MSQIDIFDEIAVDGFCGGGGWSNKQIDGKDVLCCRPGKTIQKKKPMDRFCYYCLATLKSKKIGNKASWTGRTPKWCPLGREMQK